LIFIKKNGINTTQTPKGVKMAEEQKPKSRSEREAELKDMAGLVIVIIALLLAVNQYFANNFSGIAQTRLLQASNTYGFYQSKSIKQSIAEGIRDDAVARGDRKRVEELTAKIERYESDPKSGEGKRELLVKARQQEQDREDARAHGPWLTFSGMLYQLAIVLLSASILAVNRKMYWTSIGVSIVATLIFVQGYFLFI
jgi:hypothetical protein